MSYGGPNWNWVALASAVLGAFVLALMIFDVPPASGERWKVFATAASVTLFLAAAAALARSLLRPDRARALWQFARRRGLMFDPRRRAWHEDWHAQFDNFTRLKPHECWNVLSGQWRRLPVTVLEHDFTVEADEDEPESRTVVVVSLPRPLPGVVIEPNRTNRPPDQASFITWYGMADSEGEITEFERRYVVMAEDRSFAPRLLHPDMKALLLKRWDIGVEVSGQRAVFFADHVLEPNSIPALLDFAADFCALIPQP